MEPAKFRFKKLGPIQEAELELGDLTIITGRNNTGKTYLAYTLYGFLTQYALWRRSKVRGIVAALALIEQGHSRIIVDRAMLNQDRRKTIYLYCQDFSQKSLASVFSSPPEAFESATLEVELADDVPLERSFHLEDDFLSIEYDGTDIVATLKDAKQQRLHNYTHAFSRLYDRLLFPELPFDPFILSAERFSIPLFYKELDFTRNQLVDLLQKWGDDKGRDRLFPSVLIGENTSRYALPIKDNIDYTRAISNLRARKSELYKDKLFDSIKDMMGGYYRSSNDNIELLSKRSERNFKVPLHIASSSARGLSDLYFYLRHVASKNQLVIIDEPESHLDTANQILLARLLARMVKAGLKILITTHSDYIIKEVNNLIMLSRFQSKKEVIKNLGYKKDDFIAPSSIQAYVAEEDSLTECAVDKFGIEMPVFDETIDEINRISNDLASRIELAEDGIQ